jgi:polygalacturonase
MHQLRALIYAHECRNVAITGKGRLVARMDVWHEWAKRPKAHLDALVAVYQMARARVPTAQRDMTRGEAHLRPQFIQFNRCQNVLVEDIAIENSPFWTIHLYLRAMW